MSKVAQSPTAEPVTLLAADGYRVAATKFHAQGPLKGYLVIAGATGVRQDFYRRFANFAAARGFTTMTVDYRGLGLSKPPSLVGFEASFLEWAQLDMAAAVDAMASDELPLFWVGHSFGGHALGLLPNHQRIAACYIFGTGAGWHGWMQPWESWRVRILWQIIMPLLTRWKAYLPGTLVGLGEDMPLGVYRQWKRWCSFPRYFFDDPRMPEIAERFAKVRTPMVAANAVDDAWAPPRSRDAFIWAYCNAPLERVDIAADASLGEIGHMGYFRQNAQVLWEDALAWFSRVR